MTDFDRALTEGDAIIDEMRMHVKRSSTNRIHSHPYAELVIVDKGDIVYTAGGCIKRLGDKTVIYNPPHSIHNPFVQYSRLYERYKIRFFPEDISIGCAELSAILKSPFAKEIDNGIHEEIYLAARGLFRRANTDGTLAIGTFERLALSYVLMAANDACEHTAAAERQYIDDVADYILNHLSERLTAEDIAAHHFVSKSKLNYDFKAYSNMTVNEYITLSRVERAKALLALGKSVGAVADECGFSSPSYFIKVFRDTVGTTPLKYQINRDKR